VEEESAAESLGKSPPAAIRRLPLPSPGKTLGPHSRPGVTNFGPPAAADAEAFPRSARLPYRRFGRGPERSYSRPAPLECHPFSIRPRTPGAGQAAGPWT